MMEAHKDHLYCATYVFTKQPREIKEKELEDRAIRGI